MVSLGYFFGLPMNLMFNHYNSLTITTLVPVFYQIQALRKSLDQYF